MVDAADLTIGPSSVITACGAARLGLKVAFIGVVGDDVYGRFMLTAMQERSIDISHCLIDPTLQTGFTVILAKTGWRPRHAHHAGTIATLQPEQVNRELLRQTRHLHVGSYFCSMVYATACPICLPPLRLAAASPPHSTPTVSARSNGKLEASFTTL
ncbi:MAG: PfkB family carbohydrate kinase [Chloroflexi bacterium]|nr:PfkB family carbohydrate kinase [Chloroflexota bacterium]